MWLWKNLITSEIQELRFFPITLIVQIEAPDWDPTELHKISIELKLSLQFHDDLEVALIPLCLESKKSYQEELDQRFRSVGLLYKNGLNPISQWYIAYGIKLLDKQTLDESITKLCEYNYALPNLEGKLRDSIKQLQGIHQTQKKPWHVIQESVWRLLRQEKKSICAP